MKRKAVKAGKLRLSPNEEAVVLKEDYERRRKLRLLQVREQERDIALQIRENIKQRRNQQFTQLAEELRAEWEESQTQKIKSLEKLYLASLKHMGEGHRQAKENEPDLDGLAQRAAERRKRAEMRHKEALKIQKNQKEILMKQKNRHIDARKEALLAEKERSAKITSLPPPPPTLLENIDVKGIPSVKTSSATYHHLNPLVNRETGTKQPDPHSAAAEEAKRLEELQKQVAQERQEQFEKAHVRGFHAMKKIHLAQNQEKLMKELKQLQQEDLARRRQKVARMPPQLVELPYKRTEMKEAWQRELEFAFEDMYSAGRIVKGDLILHLEPEPVPTVIDQTQDEELDLSMEQENASETENLQVTEAGKICPTEIDVPLVMKTQEVPSKILFTKLLNKIRSQKSLWTIQSVSEDESEMITATSEARSTAPTVESGTVTSEELALPPGQQPVESDTLTIESGPLSTEDKTLSCTTDTEKQQEVNETQPLTTVVQNSVLLHPQEEAARIRMSARQKQIIEIEEQKQKQLELLEQIEQQKLKLEADCFKAQLEEERRRKAPQSTVNAAPEPGATISDEDSHRQMIHNYQHQLLEQSRLHRQSIEAARKQLHDYQTVLKERYLSVSTPSTIPDSAPPQKAERPTLISEHRDQGQRPKLSPSKLHPVQISQLEQSHYQVPREKHFSQRQAEMVETFGASNVLARQCVEPQEHLRLFPHAETQQRPYTSVPISRALSPYRPVILQNAREIPRAAALQSVDSQQILPDPSPGVSSKLTEASSFLPLVAERSFCSLPAKEEHDRAQEHLATKSESVFSLGHSIVSQTQDRPLLSSEHLTAQRGNVKALQEQLDLQKEVHQARQESQEQFLLHKQKELEEQLDISLFVPSVAPRSFLSLPSAKAELGQIHESSLSKKDTAVCAGHPVFPQIQERPLNFSLSDLSQQDKIKLLHGQLNVQRDVLQARREAQEVLCVQKQREWDESVSSEQAVDSSTTPSLLAQRTFPSLSSLETRAGKGQRQYLSKSEEGVFSSQSEMPASQDQSSHFLRGFLPQQDCFKLLQGQLTVQRDALQARHETQTDVLVHRESNLEVSASGQMSPLFSTIVAQNSVASQASAKPVPRRIQNLSLSEASQIPSNHMVIPTFQDKSLPGFPQHKLGQHENVTTLHEQSHMQRGIQGTNQAVWDFVRKHGEMDKRFSAEPVGPSSSLFQIAELERSREFMSLKNDSSFSLSHSVIPAFQERPLRCSQQTPLKDHFEGRQEWLDMENRTLQFGQKAQENQSSEQAVSSSFLSQAGTSLPPAGTVQEPVLIESDSEIVSSHFQVPQLQDRLLRISQLIQPQQENLKSLQEQLATQRQSIVQSRPDTQEQLHLHQQSGWKEKISPELAGATSFVPSVAQHSFASAPLTELKRIQQSYPPKTENATSSSLSEIARLPEQLLDLSKPVLPQQNNLITPQEQLGALPYALPPGENTQVLPRPCRPEEKRPGEHSILPHYGDLTALQKQLSVQRRTIRSAQEVQEQLLSQRLSQLEKRVSSEQVNASSLLPQVALPVDAERTREFFPVKSSNTIPSNDPEVPETLVSLMSLPWSGLPQQDNLIALQEQLDLEREMKCSSEKTQEEMLLNKQSKLSKSDSCEHTLFSLTLPKELEPSFIPLPFAEAKSKRICERESSSNEQKAPSSNFMTPELQSTLRFSQPLLAQQDNVGLQKQLNLQRKALHYSQKAQKELLVHRQTALQQQIQKHQETLKDFFKDNQTSKPPLEDDLKGQKMEQLRGWFPCLQDLARDHPEGGNHAHRNGSGGHELLSEVTAATPSGEHLNKELGRRSSKPPLAKVQCGLDLHQHELSAIQEVESPGSARASILSKRDFCHQDRDLLRVSISREHSLLDSSADLHSLGHHLPGTHKNVSRDDSDEAVEAKAPVAENHTILSHAVEEQAPTYLGSTLKPESKTETHEMSHEPLSSITISTGSFLSYENTDFSLTDPESSTEQVDHRQQVSTTGKEEETSFTSSVTPSVQTFYRRQESFDIHKPPLSVLETLTSGQTNVLQIIDKYINEASVVPGKTDSKVPTVGLDFTELEHAFPNLHRQLFQPLESCLDFDLSLTSGTSQESKDFSKGPESSSPSQHTTTASFKGSVSLTGQRSSMCSSRNASLDQQRDFHLAPVAAQRAEQSFQELAPEFSVEEGSQYADLPSVFSIEAGDSSQVEENQNHPSEEMLPNKKNPQFPVCLETVSSSSDEGNVFRQLNVQHSTPCGSTSSECSIKDQQEDGRKGPSFTKVPERGLHMMLESQGAVEVDQCAAGEPPDRNPYAEETDSELRVRTVEMGTSLLTPPLLTNQNENDFETPTFKRETPESLSNLSQPAPPELFLSAASLSAPGSVPTWETESGCGIMEEPELTLVSTSDISVAETAVEFENLTLQDKEVSEFLPLVPETGSSDSPSTEPSGKQTSTSTETLPTLRAVPESLQEAFFKKKKLFIARSTLRQKEIRDRAIRVTENPPVVKPTGSSVNQLKSKVSLPEDRKSEEALMYQRTLRSYNQLAEVKQQRERKATQEAYAQNRARAREFHKKTLAKLRARNTR
ncbi:centrosomal protein of 295 kDa isoform X1 [Echinops telfairi]|uniref:Centrosomal protein of 295 kDa isoform X1 n=1 Tax=Echinops telfairi TaxID=9371 RepID=A0AC55DBI6_ECHTE|nr:centrosomal protein of 295 kDa isoform X1 [Echinops telfairi]